MPRHVVTELRRQGVMLDSIVIGMSGIDLECVATLTGGCRFRADSFEDSLALCDNETVVRASARKDAMLTAVAACTNNFLV